MPRMAIRAAVLRRDAERGSIVPLIVGFFLVALLFSGAAVMASDAFTRQRDLQSICDGAASAAANSVDFGAVRSALDGAQAVPLADAQTAVEAYLAADPDRDGVQATAAGNGATVAVRCERVSRLAFGALLGRGAGVEQHASSNATAPLD
jgi:Putative Flp pilus-assembly TadE/G-like